MYGSASWTMKVELENRLRRTQRQMLRMILASPRRVAPSNHGEQTASESEDDDNFTKFMAALNKSEENLEPYVDWLRRSTHDAESRLAALKIEDWVTMQRRRQWKRIGTVARAPSHSWSAQAIWWDPLADSRYNPRRVQGHPRKKWLDEVRSYLGEDAAECLQKARDEKTWIKLEDGFATR